MAHILSGSAPAVNSRMMGGMDGAVTRTPLSQEPYWWAAARPADDPAGPLPARCDVAIVGSGITGLNAAIPLARAGRSVLVLDEGALGRGASSRNAGYVGRTLKHRFSKLIETVGLEQALRIYRELQGAFDAVASTIREERIECGFAIRGRVIPAPSPAHYEGLAREFEAQAKHLGVQFEMVPRGEQHRELGTDRYHGGAVVPDLAGLHPALYHAGLLGSAAAAGVSFAAHTPVQSIRRSDEGCTLATARGQVRAREVVVATNGYTGRATPWLARRMVPFDAYMVATEPLDPKLMDRVLPTRRTCIDWNNDALYARPSPDLTRVLFGGLTGTRPGHLRRKAERLEQILKRTFPDLRDVSLEHVWTGRCAATRDMFPHLKREGPITYVGGYCFAGVPMGTWLGRKAALGILQSPEAATIFSELDFRGLPLHRGGSWFVPAAMAYYRWQDRRDAAARS
jgi:glycine/D-amino acid oxidase-like deaminating enzyme